MVALLLSPVRPKPVPGIYIFSRDFEEDNLGVKADSEPYETPELDDTLEESTLTPGPIVMEVEAKETEIFTRDANSDTIKGASSAAYWKHQIFFK